MTSTTHGWHDVRNACITSSRRTVPLWVVLYFSVVTVTGQVEDKSLAGHAILEEMRLELQSQSGTESPAVAKARVSDPQIKPHHAHGKKPFDYTREVTLENPSVKYRLRYWTTCSETDGTNCAAIEGSTGLGMDKPSAANWYSNNFFEFRYDNREILRNSLPTFSVPKTEGEQAEVQIRWNTADATVTLTISLGARSRHLAVRCEATATGDAVPKAVTLGFRAYPGHYPAPRARCLMTPCRQLSAPASLELTAKEAKVMLFDEQDPDTCCAMDLSEAEHVAATLDMQTYGTTITLDLKPGQTTRTGLIKLWDVARTPLNSAMQDIFGQ